MRLREKKIEAILESYKRTFDLDYERMNYIDCDDIKDITNEILSELQKESDLMQELLNLLEWCFDEFTEIYIEGDGLRPYQEIKYAEIEKILQKHGYVKNKKKSKNYPSDFKNKHNK